MEPPPFPGSYLPLVDLTAGAFNFYRKTSNLEGYPSIPRPTLRLLIEYRVGIDDISDPN